jgi:hypothetical protein
MSYVGLGARVLVVRSLVGNDYLEFDALVCHIRTRWND